MFFPTALLKFACLVYSVLPQIRKILSSKIAVSMKIKKTINYITIAIRMHQIAVAIHVRMHTNINVHFTCFVKNSLSVMPIMKICCIEILIQWNLSKAVTFRPETFGLYREVAV